MNYNLISDWDPVFRAMIKEGWVEPVTLDEMPALKDIPPGDIPSLPNTPSPAPMPNFPITDIPGANSGGPNNGA